VEVVRACITDAWYTLLLLLLIMMMKMNHPACILRQTGSCEIYTAVTTNIITILKVEPRGLQHYFRSTFDDSMSSNLKFCQPAQIWKYIFINMPWVTPRTAVIGEVASSLHRPFPFSSRPSSNFFQNIRSRCNRQPRGKADVGEGLTY